MWHVWPPPSWYHSTRPTHQTTPESWILPEKITPGYWQHNWRPISFNLIVDDFGVKYINKDNVEHLMSVLQQDYEIDTDWDGTRYLGLTLDWDYIKHKVHCSMPGYIEKRPRSLRP